MIKITSECLLSNILFYKDINIKMSDLKKMRNNLYTRLIDECFYVDISNNSIYSAIETNSFLFKLNKDNFISRGEGFSDYNTGDYLEEYVNEGIPTKYKNAIKELIKNIFN